MGKSVLGMFEAQRAALLGLMSPARAKKPCVRGDPAKKAATARRHAASAHEVKFQFDTSGVHIEAYDKLAIVTLKPKRVVL